jgi:hypothetical protein
VGVTTHITQLAQRYYAATANNGWSGRYYPSVIEVVDRKIALPAPADPVVKKVSCLLISRLCVNIQIDRIRRKNFVKYSRYLIDRGKRGQLFGAQWPRPGLRLRDSSTRPGGFGNFRRQRDQSSII